VPSEKWDFVKWKYWPSFVEKAAEILARRDAADGAGENVIEHEGGDAEFGEAAAEGLLDGAIDAAADEHAAAFDVTARTAYENNMMARMNQGAVLPMKPSASPPA